MYMWKREITALKMDNTRRVVSWIMVMENLTASTNSIPNIAKPRYVPQFKKSWDGARFSLAMVSL